MPRFHTASAEEIRSGQVTDIYFQNTLQVLRAEGANPHVVGEVMAKEFPGGWAWGVLAGVEEAAHLLEGLDIGV